MTSTAQLVPLVAQWLPPLVVVAAALVGMMLPRTRQVRVLVHAVLALLLAVLAVKVAGGLHADPRPFVVDPTLHPLFPHPADNGFPSDHTTFAVAAGTTLLGVRRRTGAVLVVLGVVGGLARVLAHVHHVQDVVGGAVLGLAAAGLAAAVVPRLMVRRPLAGLDEWWTAQTSSASRARTRRSISSRMGRTSSTDRPAGSSRAQSR